MSKHYKVQDDLLEEIKCHLLDKEPIAVVAARVNEILDETLDQLAGMQDQNDQLARALENMLMLAEEHPVMRAHTARIASNRMVLDDYEKSKDAADNEVHHD